MSRVGNPTRGELGGQKKNLDLNPAQKTRADEAEEGGGRKEAIIRPLGGSA